MPVSGRAKHLNDLSRRQTRRGNRDGRIAAIMTCDICDTIIGDAMEGAAVFAIATEEGQTLPAMHAHKLSCLDKAEGLILRSAKAMGWEELSVHMLNLTHNLELSPARLEAIAERQDSFGI